MKIIIIGNGAAGASAAEAIISKDQTHSITMITDENTYFYYRPMLSEYLSSDSLPKKFYWHEADWYKKNNISLLINTKVKQLDKSNQSLQLEGGEKLTYDRLILATGSHNFIPPMEGCQLPNVLNLRTLSDADHIKSLVRSGSRVVIIGGGLLGLEIGWQLKKIGAEISVVEMMNRLLPRQLDEEASSLFLEKVKATGMKILTGVGTKSVQEEDKLAKFVHLDNGEKLPCDYIVVSIGVRANVTLAKEADLTINRAIVVDEKMQTSHPNIWAAGDCAEYSGMNYSIWPEATSQGKIAGLNAIEASASYDPIIPFNMYHGMDLKLFSMGDVGGIQDKAYEVIRRGDNDAFEKYFFSDGVLVGGILMGDISKSAKLKKALSVKTSKNDFSL